MSLALQVDRALDDDRATAVVVGMARAWGADIDLDRLERESASAILLHDLFDTDHEEVRGAPAASGTGLATVTDINAWVEQANRLHTR